VTPAFSGGPERTRESRRVDSRFRGNDDWGKPTEMYSSGLGISVQRVGSEPYPSVVAVPHDHCYSVPERENHQLPKDLVEAKNLVLKRAPRTGEASGATGYRVWYGKPVFAFSF
jgi:hypothetical protein